MRGPSQPRRAVVRRFGLVSLPAILVLCLLPDAPAREAGRGFDDCDALVDREPASWASYRCYNEVAQVSGELDEAASRLDAWLWADPRNRFALCTLAYLESSRDADRAEPLLHRCIEAAVDAGDRSPEMFSRLELHYFLARRGRLDEADEELAAAERAARVAEDEWLVAVQLNRASQLQRRSNYGGSERLLRSIEQGLFPAGPAWQRALWLSLMGTACHYTGRLDEAMAFYERNAELHRQLDNRHEELNALYNLALAASQRAGSFARGTEEWQESIRRIRRAMDAAVAAGDRRTEARCRLLLAEASESIAGKRGQLRQAIAILERTQDHVYLLEALLSLGASLVVEPPHDGDAGRRLLERADELADRSRGPYPAALAAATRARVARAFAAGASDAVRAEALDASLAALDAVESIRDLQPDHLSRARTFGQWSAAYTSFVSDLASASARNGTTGRDDLALAFHVLERYRARVLLDELDAGHVSDALTLEEPAARRREEVLAEITRVQRELLRPELPAEERRRQLSRLAHLESEEVALRAELARASARFARLRTTTTATLEQLEAALDDDEAFLSYVLVAETNRGDRSWLFVHTRRRTTAYPMPWRGDVEAAVQLLVGLILGREEIAPGASRLHEDLLADAMEDLPVAVTRLIVAPDGPLHKLPFGVLKPAGDAEPLGARLKISIVPSATLWLRWRAAGVEPASWPALVVADPELPAMTADAASRSVGLEGIGALGRLPHARREARLVARRLGGGTRIVEGARADERSIKEQPLDRYALLHFAAHALVDDRHPERSALVLAPHGELEDGLLQLREVVTLGLDGRPVILSACSSAGGTVLGGEGVMSLARAFFVAGSHAVLGSLWPLRDDEAVALIDEFYRHLARGGSLAAALSEARRARIREGAPPAAWAGLVLLGHGDTVPFPGGTSPRSNPWSALLLVGGVVLAVVLLLYRWRLRRPPAHPGSTARRSASAQRS